LAGGAGGRRGEGAGELLEQRVGGFVVEVLLLAQLARLGPTELIPSALTREDRFAAGQLLDSVDLRGERRGCGVEPFDLDAVAGFGPHAVTNPEGVRHGAAELVAGGAHLALGALHEPCFVGADAVGRRRVRGVLTEVADGEAVEAGEQAGVVRRRLVEVAEVRRAELADLRLGVLIAPNRPEVRLPHRERLAVLVDEVAFGHAEDPSLRYRVCLRGDL
jgi:hypothetical protein